MRRLPIETRGRAIGMIQAGQSFTVVSRLLRCAVSTVQRLGQKFTQTGNDSILWEKAFKNNRYGSLPLTPPHPWVCFKFSVLPISGQMADMVRRSRGKVTTQVQDNRIRIRDLRNRRPPSTKTAAVTIGSDNCPIRAHTVIRRLRERGI